MGPFWPALIAALTFNAELGQQTALSTSNADQATLSKALFYAEPSARLSLGEFQFDGAFRGWADTQERDARFFERQTKYTLTGAWTHQAYKITAGFQEIAWGETFGAPVVDVVNPRDFTDPLIQQPSWERLPVAAINAQAFYEKLTLQAILTPVSRENRYYSGAPRGSAPDLPAPLTLGTHPLQDVSSSPEYGGRASYLFPNGIDLGLIYYRHWNRNPVYELTPAFQILPVQEQVHSTGLTFSEAVESFASLVLRGDALYVSGIPLDGVNLGFPERDRSRLMGTLGADLTTSTDWSFGLQYQQLDDFLSLKTREFRWASGKISKKWSDTAYGTFEPALFVFQGVGNLDRWIQPKLTWNPPHAAAWSLELRADVLRGGLTPNDGLLWLVRDESRVMSWLTFRL
jgi:hypothetical protein